MQGNQERKQRQVRIQLVNNAESAQIRRQKALKLAKKMRSGIQSNGFCKT